MSPVTPAWLQTLPPEQQAELKAEYEERAAIREYEGGQPRFAAEMGAWDDLRRRTFAKRDERRLGDDVEHGIPSGPRPSI